MVSESANNIQAKEEQWAANKIITHAEALEGTETTFAYIEQKP